jgi:hypothetical protein
MRACLFCAAAVEDSVVVCRKCLEKLPPTSGTPEAGGAGSAVPHRPAFRNWAFAALGTAGLAAAVAAVAVLRPPAQPQRPPATEVLPAVMRFTGEAFTVRNTGSEPWTNIKLEINGSVDGYEYFYRGSVVVNGELAVKALDFAKRDGSLFNPYLMKPEQFAVYADVKGGRRSASASNLERPMPLNVR